MVKPTIFDATGSSSEAQTASNLTSRQTSNFEEAQETIYAYLLDIIKQWSPENVLKEFRHLFIQDDDPINSNVIRSIYEIVFANDRQEFHYTLKRSCYILVNNWVSKRKFKYIQQLLEILNDPITKRKSLSPMVDRLRGWMQAFAKSDDYQKLELYAQAKFQEHARWNSRYAPILLSTQYNDLRNPIEQREAARNRALQLRCRFKFDLAMYMARFESAGIDSQIQNPTDVGDEILRVIKLIVAKRDTYSYANMANVFSKTTQGQNYKKFKQSLKDYLLCYGESQEFSDTLKLNLWHKLDSLYETWHDQLLTDTMLLKTCNKLIDYLTTDKRKQPSPLLESLISQGNPLTVVILLLKIVLICQPARIRLEACVADLIMYHEKSPESCVWMTNFIEIFTIIFAIYADNMTISVK
ncbi:MULTISPECIES: hypothetical protein [Chroococcidiopsis]|jgi:hypothetical protein|uniref:Uncharacterized protein n=1 Tax=Chroococcidiopsis thermalis (strain PCC 7203) TaxID=251229 RepID=K9U738_CHRTP|nr:MULTISPECIES: hypothetical protein [Chroococcidiopsis]AFY90236.1 hypothetical protein Chro_4856 [Chroococcidiopsis thermalis PCC 7203]PSB47981.1 hypothetical protein C7B80_07780 [Cyanosarcina cf. burmensis CCALA 770]URD49635.1 hypothetical protein M5J74_25345 [Chroococcidiopsis sp. CCNUC1]